jgi:hypothetical protein
LPTCLPSSRMGTLSECGSLYEHVVYIAPAPVLSRLERPDYRVAACVEVLGSVFIGRCVATAYVPASQALSQMNPRIAHLQALLAALGGRRYVFSYLVGMFALLSPEHLHEPPHGCGAPR